MVNSNDEPMNEIAKQRTAEKFDEAIKKDGLTKKQVSEITGINYFYVGKACNPVECHKVPQWVMHYLREWVNTGEGIISAKWERIAMGYPKINPGNSETINLIKKGRRMTKPELEELIKVSEEPEQKPLPDQEELLDLLPDEKPAETEPEEMHEEPTPQQKLIELLSKIALDEIFKQRILHLEERISKLEQKLESNG